jgi:tetratricopeptide (TPR) repeat protein
MAHSFKAHALHLCGEDQQAGELFEKSDAILTMEDPGSKVTFPTISSYYCKYLLETGQPEKALDRSLKTFSWRSKGGWQVAIDTTSLLASDMQILGLASLALGDHANGKLYLDKQVDLLKEADEWLYLPSGLNARANFYLAVGDCNAAGDDLEDALEISKRTGARFGEWETYLNLMNLYVQKQEFSKARKASEELDKITGMSLYTFRDDEIKTLRSEINLAHESSSSHSGEKEKAASESV